MRVQNDGGRAASGSVTPDRNDLVGYTSALQPAPPTISAGPTDKHIYEPLADMLAAEDGMIDLGWDQQQDAQRLTRIMGDRSLGTRGA